VAAARRIVLLLGASLLVLSACGGGPSRRHDTASVATPAPRHVPRLIVDTDLGLWWDDAAALGVVNVLARRGAVQLLAVVSDVPDRLAVAAIDAIDIYYGNADVPVGAVAGSSADTAAHGYVDALVERLPHSVRSSSDAPAAVDVYRRALAAQPDRSVTVVAIGSYTNLAALLRSGPDAASRLGGRALVAAKVTRLVVEDGIFPGGAPPLTNQKLDPAATAAVVAQGGWPTPITWVDGTTGVHTLVGASLCGAVPSDDPMRVVYEAKFGCGPPGDGNWDGPTVLYAAGDATDLFEELGSGGAATIGPSGGLVWEPDATRPDDRYVHVRDQDSLNRRLDELLTSR
jgi:hypothetical protein